MTQDERWLSRYNEVKAFIERERRNPSKYYPEEKLMVHFLKRGRKLMNAGEMPEDRIEKFKVLLALAEENKHVNQYQRARAKRDGRPTGSRSLWGAEGSAA